MKTNNSIKRKESNRICLLYMYDSSYSEYQSMLVEALCEISDEIILLSKNQMQEPYNEMINSCKVQFICSEEMVDVFSSLRFLYSNEEHKSNLMRFDEMVVASDRIFGPFYDLENYFDSIPQDVFYWNFSNSCHISTDEFFVLKKAIYSLPSFEKIINNRNQTDFEYEKLSKEKFDETFNLCFKNYKSYSCCCNTDAVYGEGEDKIYYISDLVIKYKYPFLPIELFDVSKGQFLEYNNGNDISRVIEYIDKFLFYDKDAIIKYLLKKKNIVDLKQIFNWSYILPTEYAKKDSSIVDTKVAVIAHLYYEDMFEYCISYLENVPKGIHIYITTNSLEKKEIILQLLKNKSVKIEDIILSQNRGRELAALLVECRDIAKKYEYFCFLHDKKSSGKEHLSVGLAFRDLLWDACLFSEEYISNVIDVFESNKCLGLLVPPTIYCGSYFYPFPDYWVGNYEKTVELAKSLGVKADIDCDKDIVCTGSVFWCRTKALKKMLNFDFSYKFFPKEPMGLNLTISHCIERIFPFVASDEGYYTATVIPDKIAEIEVENLRYMLGKTSNLLRTNLYQNGKSFNESINVYYRDEKTLIDACANIAIYVIEEKSYADYIEYNLKQLKDKMFVIYLICNAGITIEARAAYSKYTKTIIVNNEEKSLAFNWKNGIDRISTWNIEHCGELLLITDSVLTIDELLAYRDNYNVNILCRNEMIYFIKYKDVDLSSDLVKGYWDVAKDNKVEAFCELVNGQGLDVSVIKQDEPVIFKNQLCSPEVALDKEIIETNDPFAYKWLLSNLNAETLAHKFNLNYWIHNDGVKPSGKATIYIYLSENNKECVEDLFKDINLASCIEVYTICVNDEYKAEDKFDSENTLFNILTRESALGDADYIGVFNFVDCSSEMEILYVFKNLVGNVYKISEIFNIFNKYQYIGMIGCMWETAEEQLKFNKAILDEYKNEIVEYEQRYCFTYCKNIKHPLLNYDGFWFRKEALSTLLIGDRDGLLGRKICKAQWIVIPEILKNSGFLLGIVHSREELKRLFIDNVYSVNKLISAAQNNSNIKCEDLDEYISKFNQRIVTKVEKEYEYVNVPIGVKGAVKNFIKNRIGRDHD